MICRTQWIHRVFSISVLIAEIAEIVEIVKIVKIVEIAEIAEIAEIMEIVKPYIRYTPLNIPRHTKQKGQLFKLTFLFGV